ncbi:unnamed protein product [Vitrella brassicaformis CCMP3155]|uniref:Uncharacterized protein n=1 Tax=Vitrella brassicaformis (strain CCMP3155) TaxID=1169540 RepID=A0A0G4ELA4_VITBC|nr:unnamed protein product [Vitrella brassicaformis CCMP3155]|eukprot:CEL97732.1 unnamed protein product [Vitrella brassicaformis CCMP3155]
MASASSDNEDHASGDIRVPDEETLVKMLEGCMPGGYASPDKVLELIDGKNDEERFLGLVLTTTLPPEWMRNEAQRILLMSGIHRDFLARLLRAGGTYAAICSVVLDGLLTDNYARIKFGTLIPQLVDCLPASLVMDTQPAANQEDQQSSSSGTSEQLMRVQRASVEGTISFEAVVSCLCKASTLPGGHGCVDPAVMCPPIVGKVQQVGVERMPVDTMKHIMSLWGHMLPLLTDTVVDEYCDLLMDTLVRRQDESTLMAAGVLGGWLEKAAEKAQWLRRFVDRLEGTLKALEVLLQNRLPNKERCDVLNTVVQLIHNYGDNLIRRHGGLLRLALKLASVELHIELDNVLLEPLTPQGKKSLAVALRLVEAIARGVDRLCQHMDRTDTQDSDVNLSDIFDGLRQCLKVLFEFFGEIREGRRPPSDFRAEIGMAVRPVAVWMAAEPEGFQKDFLKVLGALTAELRLQDYTYLLPALETLTVSDWVETEGVVPTLFNILLDPQLEPYRQDEEKSIQSTACALLTAATLDMLSMEVIEQMKTPPKLPKRRPIPLLPCRRPPEGYRNGLPELDICPFNGPGIIVDHSPPSVWVMHFCLHLFYKHHFFKHGPLPIATKTQTRTALRRDNTTTATTNGSTAADTPTPAAAAKVAMRRASVGGEGARVAAVGVGDGVDMGWSDDEYWGLEMRVLTLALLTARFTQLMVRDHVTLDELLTIWEVSCRDWLCLAPRTTEDYVPFTVEGRRRLAIWLRYSRVICLAFHLHPYGCWVFGRAVLAHNQQYLEARRKMQTGATLSDTSGMGPWRGWMLPPTPPVDEDTWPQQDNDVVEWMRRYVVDHLTASQRPS